jgi:hypothetical protein
MDTKLTSKIDFKQAGLLFAIAVLFFGAVSVILFQKGLSDLDDGKSFFKTTLPVSAFLFSFSLYSIYYFIVFYPQIILTNNGITFKNILKTNFYDWSQIKDIKLTGKHPMRFLYLSMPMEATVINFNDGTKKVVWADNYRNTAIIRTALNTVKQQLNLKQVVNLDRLKINSKRNYRAEAAFLSYKEFRGDLITSINGIIIFGWLLFILLMVASKPQVFLSNMGALLSISFATVVICGMMIYQLHYFVITDTQVIVKNHIWVWTNKVYDLDKIVEVAVETPHKRSTSLRVIDKDFNSKLYPAGTLRDGTWKELTTELVDRQIIVRNEAYV